MVRLSLIVGTWTRVLVESYHQEAKFPKYILSKDLIIEHAKNRWHRGNYFW